MNMWDRCFYKPEKSQIFFLKKLKSLQKEEHKGLTPFHNRNRIYTFEKDHKGYYGGY